MDRKVIALDIGQVCVQVRGELCFAKLGYRSAAEVPRELFVLNDEMEKGRLTADEYFERFRELTGSELDKEAMLEAFCSIIAAPVPGMSELVARLPGHGIGRSFSPTPPASIWNGYGKFSPGPPPSPRAYTASKSAR